MLPMQVYLFAVKDVNFSSYNVCFRCACTIFLDTGSYCGVNNEVLLGHVFTRTSNNGDKYAVGTKRSVYLIATRYTN